MHSKQGAGHTPAVNAIRGSSTGASHTGGKRLHLLFLLTLLGVAGLVRAAEDADGYDKNSTLKEAAEFFGEGAEGIGEVIEKIFEDLGEPNAYIKGTEASGALGIGA